MTVGLAGTAVVRLLASQSFRALVADGSVGRDELTTDPFYAGWVFQGLNNAGGPYRAVEGSGTSAVVLSQREGWTAPNVHNTASFPTLQVLIFSDCTRDDSRNPVARDADEKCRKIAAVIDPLFHDPGNVMHEWISGGTYIVSCVRSSELSIQDVPNSDGQVRGELRYNVTLG